MDQKFDGSNIVSIIGSGLTITLSWLWHIGKDEVMFVMAIISFLVTVGYTLDKWSRMRKGQKVD